MEIKKLIVKSLPGALKSMAVGETCAAPENIKKNTVNKTCAVLRKDGYVFLTSTRTGILTITRLK